VEIGRIGYVNLREVWIPFHNPERAGLAGLNLNPPTTADGGSTCWLGAKEPPQSSAAR